MRDGWRWGDLVREAFRNVGGRGARMLVAVALAGLFGTASVAIAVIEQHALDKQIESLAAQGRGVLVFTEASDDRPASIGRHSCERAVDEPEVQQAGLVIPIAGTDADPLVVDAPARRASSSFLRELSEADVAVGSNLAQYEGPFRVLVQGQPLDALVPGPSREGTGIAYSLTFPLLPQDTDAGMCIVVLDAMADADDLVVALVSQLDVTGNPISGREVLVQPSDPLDEYLARLTRFAPLVLGVFGGFITAILTRTRANELAVYRLSGTSRGSLMALMALEGLMIAGVAAATAAVAAVALGASLLDPATVIVSGVGLAGAWALTATIGTVDIPFRRPTDLAKDR